VSRLSIALKCAILKKSAVPAPRANLSRNRNASAAYLAERNAKPRPYRWKSEGAGKIHASKGQN